MLLLGSLAVMHGGLLPYQSVWNPGADEASRVELSDDVLVDGERLPAGKYGIWASPDRMSGR